MELGKTLQNYIQKEQYSQASQLCDTILAQGPSDKILKTKMVCLILEEKFDEALRIAVSSDFSFEAAYCYYRTNDLDSAKTCVLNCIAKDVPRVRLKPSKHLLAQILYKAGESSEALKIYQGLELENEQEKTNLIAAAINSKFRFDTLPILEEPLHSMQHELLFNIALIQSQLLGLFHQSLNTLLLSKQKAREFMQSDCINSDEADLFEINLLEGICSAFAVGPEKAMELFGSIENGLGKTPKDKMRKKILASNKYAVEHSLDPRTKYFQALRANKFSLEQLNSLSVSQRLTFHSNNALRHVFGKNKKKSVQEIDIVRTLFPRSEMPLLLESLLLPKNVNLASRKQMLLKALSEKTLVKDESVNVLARLLLIQSELDETQEQPGKYTQSKAASKVRVTRALLVDSHYSAIKIPFRFTPGVVAAFTTFYLTDKLFREALNVYEIAIDFWERSMKLPESVFVGNIKKDDHGSQCEANFMFKARLNYWKALLRDAGDVSYAARDYEKAATFYSKSISLGSSKPFANKILMAKLARSLSFFDPCKAVDVASKLESVRTEKAINVETLLNENVSDKASITTYSRKKKLMEKNNATKAQKGEIEIEKKPRKSKKRRNKKAETKKTDVDPERWLPLRERSYYKPRIKKRGKKVKEIKSRKN